VRQLGKSLMSLYLTVVRFCITSAIGAAEVTKDGRTNRLKQFQSSEGSATNNLPAVFLRAD